MLQQRVGFTLLELLIVIGMISIIASVIFAALNPGDRISQANNAKRQSEVKAIADALQQYAIDRGLLPTGIAPTFSMLGTDLSGCASTCGLDGAVTDSVCLDLTSQLVIGGYIGKIPIDPVTGSGGRTYYAVKMGVVDGLVHVRACSAQRGALIEVMQ